MYNLQTGGEISEVGNRWKGINPGWENDGRRFVLGMKKKKGICPGDKKTGGEIYRVGQMTGG